MENSLEFVVVELNFCDELCGAGMEWVLKKGQVVAPWEEHPLPGNSKFRMCLAFLRWLGDLRPSALTSLSLCSPIRSLQGAYCVLQKAL